MRKFEHEKVLEIALNVLYVASFLAVIALGISNASENSYSLDNSLDESQEDYYNGMDCMNCDEID